MNRKQLSYRIKVGGLPWLAKTALGTAASLLSRPALAESAALQIGSTSDLGPKILYIHSGWAIETVGKLWFKEQSIARVTFMQAGDPRLTPGFMAGHDLIWFGYSSLFRRHPCPRERAVLVVHDPAELFPDHPLWKQSATIPPEQISHLSAFRGVVVTSWEMEEILCSNGIETSRIPTKSMLEPIRAQDITHRRPAILSVGRIYHRKNFEQFQRIARKARSMGYDSYLKCDHYPLRQHKYIRLLDSYPVYLCTSYQEGGPLPVMDAMLRGALPLSTPVGQAPEIIQHGINGFLCQSDDDFLDVLKELSTSPNRTLPLQVAARDRILHARNDQVISNAVLQALNKALN